MKHRVTALALLVVIPNLIVAPAAAAEPARAARAASGSTAEGTTKVLPGGAVLRLSPGTVIETKRTLKLQLGAAGGTQTVTQVIKLVSGCVEVDIPQSKNPKTAVLLEGPRKVSAVAKGGHSVVIADANRVTIAAVDGDMVAASGNEWKTLPSGLLRNFVAHEPSYQEHPVPGVPTLKLSRPLLLAMGGDAPPTQADASGVKEAAHYQLSVWRVGDKGNEFLRRFDSLGPSSTAIPSLAPGKYQVTARAIDANGVSGPESAPTTLRVVGAELPAGSRYEDGAILMGRRSRVKLIGAAGLEATYGKSSHFVAAPDTVGLSHGEGTVLRLREPGSVTEVQVGLEPRAIRADVQITPKHPHWPEDMLEVTVQLYDMRGHAVSESVKVKPQVLVDVQPMDVTWMRSENILHAFIPAPNKRGPWVVRVEIEDEFGEPAGRDFIEVASPGSDRVSVR